jgi:hypothetical protein
LRKRFADAKVGIYRFRARIVAMSKTKKRGTATRAIPEPERIDWLLKFLRRDVRLLRPGERLDLVADVEKYLMARVDARHSVDSRDDSPADDPETATVDIQRRAKLESLQTEIGNGVRALEGGATWKVFEPLRFAPGEHGDGEVDRREHLIGGRPPHWAFRRTDDGEIGWYFEGNDRQVALANAVLLLVRWWPQLQRCAHCGSLFRPSHGRQRYDDPKCSFAARWSRFAPNRQRDYQKEYTTRVRRRLGARVKPAARKRQP